MVGRTRQGDIAPYYRLDRYPRPCAKSKGHSIYPRKIDKFTRRVKRTPRIRQQRHDRDRAKIPGRPTRTSTTDSDPINRNARSMGPSGPIRVTRNLTPLTRGSIAIPLGGIRHRPEIPGGEIHLPTPIIGGIEQTGISHRGTAETPPPPIGGTWDWGHWPLFPSRKGIGRVKRRRPLGRRNGEGGKGLDIRPIGSWKRRPNDRKKIKPSRYSSESR